MQESISLIHCVLHLMRNTMLNYCNSWESAELYKLRYSWTSYTTHPGHFVNHSKPLWVPLWYVEKMKDWKCTWPSCAMELVVETGKVCRGLGSSSSVECIRDCFRAGLKNACYSKTIERCGGFNEGNGWPADMSYFIWKSCISCKYISIERREKLLEFISEVALDVPMSCFHSFFVFIKISRAGSVNFSGTVVAEVASFQNQTFIFQDGWIPLCGVIYIHIDDQWCKTMFTFWSEVLKLREIICV